MFFFGIIAGIVIGYIFKPQIEKLLVKGLRYIKEKSGSSDTDTE